VAVTADGARAVSGGDDGMVRVWDLATGAQPGTITGYDGPVHAVAVSADGTRAVSGSENGLVRVWDMAQLLKDRIAAGIAHLVAVPFYVAVLAWPLALIRRHYTTTRIIDCAHSNFIEAVKTPGCHFPTVKAGQFPSEIPVLVGKGTVTVPHTGVSTIAIAVEAIWVFGAGIDHLGETGTH
jgi:WD40 repeat protein